MSFLVLESSRTEREREREGERERERGPCADPESFIRGGQLHSDKVFFVNEERERAIKLPQKAGHHRPVCETPFYGVSLAGQ